MKKYLLGPNAANFLANQMRNQGASTEEPVLHRGRVSGSIIPFKITGDWEQRNGESVYSCVAREVFFDGTNYVTDQESLDFFLYSPIHLDDKPDNEVGDVVFAVLRGNNWEIIGGGGSSQTKAVSFNTLIKGSGGYVESGEYIDTSLLDAGLAVEPKSEILTTGSILKFAVKRSIYPALMAPTITYNNQTGIITITSLISGLASGQTLYANHRIGKRTRLTTFTKSAYSGAIELTGVAYPCWVEAYMSGGMADNGLLLATPNGNQKSIPSPLTRYKVDSNNSSWTNAATQNALTVSRQPGNISTSSSRLSLQVNLTSALSSLSYFDSSDYSFDYTWKKNGSTQYPVNVEGKIGEYINTPGTMETGTTTTFTLGLRLKFDGTTYGSWNVGDYVVTRL